MKKLLFFLILTLVLFSLTGPAFAAGEGISTALTSITTWLTRVLGASAVVIGLAIFGIRLAMHDERALQKGVWVIVGGLILFLSSNIVDLLKSWAGLTQ